jgi:signal transduction histidine kinase
MNPALTASDILRALGVAAMRFDKGELHWTEPALDWRHDFCEPDTGPLAAFPFLESFLEEAREFWDSSQQEPCRSGIWIQKDRRGHERALAAEAVKAAGQNLLLLWRASREHQEKQRAIQALRDNRTAFEELESRGEELERLNRMKSHFIAGVSHELRTPLNAILGFSTLMARGRAGELNAKQAEYVGHIHTAATHLLELVNDVLDLSRAEAGPAPLDCQWFRLGQLLDEILPVIRPLAGSAKINLVTDAGEQLAIYADRLRCKQVLYNLLSNAVRFTPGGGTVTIAARQEPGAVRLLVSDTGIGIPKEEHTRIFDPYHQVPKRGAEYPQGTGLGLAIVRKLVEQHGGRVWVESEPGAGSRFIVELPAPT